PDPGFVGTDSFRYRALDAAGNATEGEATIVVEAQNLPPVVRGDAFTVVGGEVLRVTGPGVLANDSDPEGDPLVAGPGRGPANGTLQRQADGGFTYTPDPGFAGTDSFRYFAHDGNGNSVGGTVTITVTAPLPDVNAVDDAFAATAGTPLTLAAPGVLANDAFTAGGELRVEVVDGPGSGSTLALTEQSGTGEGVGAFVYTPAAGFTGTESFVYALSDASGTSDTANVTFTVEAANRAPNAVADNFTLAADGVARGDLFANNGAGRDRDPDGDPFAIVAVEGNTAAPGSTVTLASGARVTVDADGGLVYDPNGAFDDVAFGQSAGDSFVYTVEDSRGGSDDAIVRLRIDGRGPVTGREVADTLVFDTALDLTIDGRGGNDILGGGSGNDLIIGGSGDDFVRPGLGTDTIFFGDAAGRPTVGRNTVIGTVEELDGDTLVDFRSKDRIGVTDDNGTLLAARLTVGDGLVQIDVGSDGTVEAVLNTADDLFGVGSTWTESNPFA
ncbi:MAG: Ig-like domain-containing protein, partial [Pseudomonadota bacterium]